MCEPMTMGLIGGSLLGGIMAQQQKVPSMPTPTIEAPPQPTRTPDTQTALNQMKGAGQAGGAAGRDSTFTSGPGGVSTDLLKVDKKTLLG